MINTRSKRLRGLLFHFLKNGDSELRPDDAARIAGCSRPQAVKVLELLVSEGVVCKKLSGRRQVFYSCQQSRLYRQYRRQYIQEKSPQAGPVRRQAFSLVGGLGPNLGRLLRGMEKLARECADATFVAGIRRQVPLN